MSGVSGAYSKLQLIIQRVAPERIELVRRALIANLSQEARTQIAFGFEQGKAPDDTPWKPLARPRPRDAPGTQGVPLNDRGILKNSWTVSIQSNGFTWTNNLVYAAPHQYGASIAHGPRVNRHRTNGKFMSKTRAGNIKNKVRVSFARASIQHLPARPMVPTNADLPPRWKKAFESAAKSTLLGYGMG